MHPRNYQEKPQESPAIRELGRGTLMEVERRRRQGRWGRLG